MILVALIALGLVNPVDEGYVSISPSSIDMPFVVFSCPFEERQGRSALIIAGRSNDKNIIRSTLLQDGEVEYGVKSVDEISFYGRKRDGSSELKRVQANTQANTIMGKHEIRFDFMTIESPNAHPSAKLKLWEDGQVLSSNRCVIFHPPQSEQ